MLKKDVTQRADIEDIIARFYQEVLDDGIIGFIFTDVVGIELEHHLPIIVNFWADSLFDIKHKGRGQLYTGNLLQKHLDMHQKIPLRPGHFTRWLFLFSRAVDASHQGPEADAMKTKAEQVARSISAALLKTKRRDMNLTL